MTSNKSLATSLVSLSAGLLLTLSAAGGATASPAKAQDPVQPQIASATLTTSTAASYWTPERMRDAVPGDVLAAKAVARQVIVPWQVNGPQQLNSPQQLDGNSLPGLGGQGSLTKIAGTSRKGKTSALH